MKRTSLFLGLFGLLAIPSLLSPSAHAQGTQYYAWVSSTGNDTNTCSHANPCATFKEAIAKSVDGGEVHCVDGGNYAPVTITKAITIDCAGTVGVIGISNLVGIVVSAGPSDKVILRNLIFNGVGAGGSETGYDGIRFLNGGALHVENVAFSGIGPAYAGIFVNKTAFGVLTVKSSTFSRMAVGIRMQATSGSISASVTNSTFDNLANTGIEVGKGTYVTVSDSKFTANFGYGIKATTATSYASATDNVFSSSYIGMSANVAGAKINAAGNRFFGNSKAFNVAAGGVFFSGGDNKIDVNPGNPPTGALTSR